MGYLLNRFKRRAKIGFANAVLKEVGENPIPDAGNVSYGVFMVLLIVGCLVMGLVSVIGIQLFLEAFVKVKPMNLKEVLKGLGLTIFGLASVLGLFFAFIKIYLLQNQRR